MNSPQGPSTAPFFWQSLSPLTPLPKLIPTSHSSCARTCSLTCVHAAFPLPVCPNHTGCPPCSEHSGARQICEEFPHFFKSWLLCPHPKEALDVPTEHRGRLPAPPGRLPDRPVRPRLESHPHCSAPLTSCTSFLPTTSAASSLSLHRHAPQADLCCAGGSTLRAQNSAQLSAQEPC